MAIFDTNIASAKLTHVEKYKKSRIEDLNLFKNELNAEVHVSEDGKRATLKCMGQTTDVEIMQY